MSDNPPYIPAAIVQEDDLRRRLLTRVYNAMGAAELLAQREKRVHTRGVRVFLFMLVIEVVAALLGMLEHASHTSPVWVFLQSIGIQPWVPLVMANFGGKSVFSLVAVIAAASVTVLNNIKVGKHWVPARALRNQLWLLVMRFRMGVITAEALVRALRKLDERGDLNGAPSRTWPRDFTRWERFTRWVFHAAPELETRFQQFRGWVANLLWYRKKVNAQMAWGLPPNSTWVKEDDGFRPLAFSDSVLSLEGFKSYTEQEIRRLHWSNTLFVCGPILLGAFATVLFFVEIFELAWFCGHVSAMMVSHHARLQLEKQLNNNRSVLNEVDAVLYEAELLKGQVDIGTPGWPKFVRMVIDRVFGTAFDMWASTMGQTATGIWDHSSDRDRVEDGTISPRQAAQDAVDKAAGTRRSGESK